VTSDEVTTAIDSGAVTVKAVSRATGACTGCGTCLERIKAMIGERTSPCPLATALAGAPAASPALVG
jgi:bacterioferritin-associated ferredoxin